MISGMFDREEIKQRFEKKIKEKLQKQRKRQWKEEEEKLQKRRRNTMKRKNIVEDHKEERIENGVEKIWKKGIIEIEKSL